MKDYKMRGYLDPVKVVLELEGQKTQCWISNFQGDDLNEGQLQFLNEEFKRLHEHLAEHGPTEEYLQTYKLATGGGI